MAKWLEMLKKKTDGPSGPRETRLRSARTGPRRPQFALEDLAGQVDTGFDRPNGNPKLIGDVLVFVTFEIEHKGFPEFKRQQGDGLVEVIHNHFGFGLVGNPLAGLVDIVILVGLIAERIALDLAAVIVNEGVLHDGVQPAFEVGIRRKTIPVRKSLQVGFLE